MSDILDLDTSELEQKVIKFLNKNENQQIILDSAKKSIETISFSLDKIRQTDKELAELIIKKPLKLLPIFDKCLNDIAQNLRGEKMQTSDLSLLKGEVKNKFKINFEGMLGTNLVSPRGLTAELANQFVGVQGIVTRISLVRPKLQYSAHYCEKTNQGSIKEYPDQLSISESSQIVQGGNIAGDRASGYMSNTVPTRDINQNPLTFEYGYSKFTDYQTILLQEPPERTPVGQLPRSIEVVLEGNLVDKVKPGDRVQVNGVFKCVSSMATETRGTVKTVLIATNVEQLNKNIETPELTGEDIKQIKELAKNPKIFDILANSVAPGIHGHKLIKKALVLQLLGGVEKNLENGTHLRGDINVLMIGDPSTAKSQFLRYMINIAPNAINTTGRGSSGVGLTAAVVVDRDTGERHLEAGAMVLGDRGVVCIDEFDKMSEADRVAIHEVMEQQTVTIAKAGIHVSLNARCSVLAAANPIYGQYNNDIAVHRNIGFPDSLLSRFDLCFVVLDKHDSNLDRKISQRVIQNHMMPLEAAKYGDESEDRVIEPEINTNAKKKTQVFEKKNKKNSADTEDVMTRDFLRKYLYYVKTQSVPKLSTAASNYITSVWKALREKNNEEERKNKAVPVTVRSLETLIRLSTAIAKTRLSSEVSKDDATKAFDLLLEAIENSTDEEKIDENLEDDIEMKEEDDAKDDEEDINVKSKISKKRKKDKKDEEESDSERKKKTKSKKELRKKVKDSHKDEDEDLENLTKTDYDEAKGNYIYKQTSNKINASKDKRITLSDLWEAIKDKKETKTNKINSKSELLNIILQLQEQEKLFVSQDEEIMLV